MSRIKRWFHFKMTYPQMLVCGFLCLILIGTFLLSLPIASRSGQWTPVLDALFTATSASCVTGLVIYDTYSYWSLFGQIIILLLLLVGALGIMTVVALFSCML